MLPLQIPVSPAGRRKALTGWASVPFQMMVLGLGGGGMGALSTEEDSRSTVVRLCWRNEISGLIARIIKELRIPETPEPAQPLSTTDPIIVGIKRPAWTTFLPSELQQMVGAEWETPDLP